MSKNMSYTIVAIAAWLVFLVFLYGILIGVDVGDNGKIISKEHQQLIQECQAKLPRDKFCKLIAVEDK